MARSVIKTLRLPCQWQSHLTDGFLELVIAVVNFRLGSLNVPVDQRAEFVSVPVFSRSPPDLKSWIRDGVGECPLVSAPQPLIERSIQDTEIKTVGKSQETPQVRANLSFDTPSNSSNDRRARTQSAASSGFSTRLLFKSLQCVVKTFIAACRLSLF
jgi:hypothetical protein